MINISFDNLVRAIKSLVCSICLVSCVFIPSTVCLLKPIQASADELYDPFETVNRGIFWFNNQLDDYLLKPIAQGYNKIMPKVAKKGVRNFFRNIRTPIYLVSDLVQLKFDQFGNHTGRFIINTTLGFGGLADPAESFGMEHHQEDFGVSLGYHGVPEGPYLVLPILGPSNARDAVGRIVDAFLNPVNYASEVTEDGEYISYGLTALEGIDARSRLIDGIESAHDASVDYYLFIQSTYHQVRQNLIYDDNPPEQNSEEVE